MAIAFAAMALLAACGSTTRLPEAPQTSPLTSSAVAVKQTGTAAVSILPGSVTYKLDNSGSLIIHLQLTSKAKSAQTIIIRVSLYGPGGALVGDAAGGQVPVAPGATTDLQLNGPAPNGEIVSATYEVTSLPLPGS